MMAELPTLSDKHQLAALMLASSRYSVAEIATATGLSEGRMEVLAGSPLFQEAVRRFKDKLYDEQRERLMAELMGDAPKTLQFVQDVRDGLVDDAPAAIQKRLSAALALLDRQLPRKEDGPPAAAVQINISAPVAERLERAFVEAEAVKEGEE